MIPAKFSGLEFGCLVRIAGHVAEAVWGHTQKSLHALGQMHACVHSATGQGDQERPRWEKTAFPNLAVARSKPQFYKAMILNQPDRATLDGVLMRSHSS